VCTVNSLCVLLVLADYQAVLDTIPASYLFPDNMFTIPLAGRHVPFQTDLIVQIHSR
jgi:hypothetical protein